MWNGVTRKRPIMVNGGKNRIWSAALLVSLTAVRDIGVAQAASPTFSEAPPISTDGRQTPTAVTADIDRDGDQDIVSAE